MVNTADQGGGAEAIALSLVDGFQALGTETWLAVGAKRADHPRVVPLWDSPHVDYRPHAAVWRQKTLRIRRKVEERLGREDFVHPYTRYLLQVAGFRPQVVVCHNLHGGFFDLTALPWLSHEVPVIVSMADLWLLTGHCAVSLGCTRWETGCGHCPDLAIPPAIRRDATASNWRRKRRIYARSSVSVATPTHWLQRQAQASMLAEAVDEWRVIPYGIDLDTFKPGSREEARRRVGVDRDVSTLLYVANLGDKNPYKDFTTIRGALEILAASASGRRIDLLVVGGQTTGESIERLAEGVQLRRVGYCDSPSRLADYYRAADLYIHAAGEETFGITTTEALACGTPAVVAVGGGMDEVVAHGTTGLIVRPGDVAGLARSIHGLLMDEPRRQRMGQEAGRDARRRFDRDRMVGDYHDWCSEVALRWPRTVRR